jgi:hypothetical protein
MAFLVVVGRDRDEWYERQRAQQAKKLDKRKFGTLLDGVE